VVMAKTNSFICRNIELTKQLYNPSHMENRTDTLQD